MTEENIYKMYVLFFSDFTDTWEILRCVFKKKGKNYRRVLPVCVVNAILEKYTEDYTDFNYPS